MTVVVGFSDGKSWSIGGDSGAFEEGGLYQLCAEPKVWKIGDTLIGGSGSFRTMEIAKKSGLSDPFSLRNHLIESNPGGEWNLLIVTKKNLYEIDDGFNIIHLRDNYGAIGAGNFVAIGALAVASQNKIDSEKAVRLALKVTVMHSTFAVPPFNVLKV